VPGHIQPCMAGRSKSAQGRPSGRDVPTTQPRPLLRAQHPWRTRNCEERACATVVHHRRAAREEPVVRDLANDQNA